MERIEKAIEKLSEEVQTYYDQKIAQLEAEKEEVEGIVDGALQGSSESEPDLASDGEPVVSIFYDEDGKLLRLSESQEREYQRKKYGY